VVRLVGSVFNDTSFGNDLREEISQKNRRFGRDARILGIRAGTKPHRIIGIWAVVVEGRVFVRSYSLKPRSWWRTFRQDPRGVIEVNGKQFKVRPVFTRSERLKQLVDRAYAEKFPTPSSRVFVEGFKQKHRRDTTTELVPL